MSSYRLEMITPERRFFDGDCLSLVVPTPDGELGILKDHEVCVVSLCAGVVRIKTSDGWMECITTEGFMEVRYDEVIIFSHAFEWPDEVDLNRALAAKERAEQKIRDRQSREEYTRSKLALARAMVRLRAGGRKGIND